MHIQLGKMLMEFCASIVWGTSITTMSARRESLRHGFAADISHEMLGLILGPTMVIMIYMGDGSKPCTPVVHIKIAGIYGCSSP